MTAGAQPQGDAVARARRAERRRLAELLHGGIVQQITALSLAVDSALLHDAEGRSDEALAALSVVRRVTDVTVADCRALLEELRDSTDP